MSVALQRDTEAPNVKPPVTHLQAPISSQFVDQAVNIIKEEIHELSTQLGLLMDCSEDEIEESVTVDRKLARKVALRLKELGAALRFARFPVLSKLTLSMARGLDKCMDRDGCFTAQQRSALFTNCQLLARYVDMSIEFKGPEIGLIVSPCFQRLAEARLSDHAVEADYYSSPFILDKAIEDMGPLVIELTDDALVQTKRSRQMLQIALIGLLRGDLSAQSFNLIRRVSDNSQAIGESTYSLVWKKVGVLAEALSDGALLPSSQRVTVFTYCDRLLRAVSKREPIDFKQAPFNKMLAELELQLALSDKQTGNALGAFQIPPTISEQEVLSRRQRIESGYADAVNAVALYCRDTLEQSRVRLNTLASGEDASTEELDKLALQLSDMASVSQFCGLNFLHDKLVAAECALSNWCASFSSEKFEALASEMLAAESSASWLIRSTQKSSILENSDADGVNSHVADAEAKLCEEIQGSISLSTRALSVYSESDYDAKHIANLDKSLHAAAAGFKMLGHDHVQVLLELCAEKISGLEQSAAEDFEAGSREQLLSLIADCIVTADALVHEAGSGRAPSGLYQELISESISMLQTT